ncbi:hypothetical protein QBC38DRAFT_453808 [Podospora fimiseda]|uniref:F-box domain-containing protein n=1 Tax=Podospora fimiseda TaxID=252190 RepID=A0AAN7H1P3_9PEZI|nr:hypothetical protein QBC38DRAFT_453808 [Podospora fimiseda]
MASKVVPAPSSSPEATKGTTTAKKFLTCISQAKSSSSKTTSTPSSDLQASSSSSADNTPPNPGLASPDPVRQNPYDPTLTSDPVHPPLFPHHIDPNRKNSAFLSLPAEIRNEIYSYLTQYPTCQELYSKYNKKIDQYYTDIRRGKKTSFPEYVKEKELKTPTVLLICKGITEECMPMLKSQRFVVDMIPPWRPGEGRPMKLTEFVSEKTLEGLRRVEVYVQLGQGNLGSGWVWQMVLGDIMRVFKKINSFELFGVAFSMHNPHYRSMFSLEEPYLYRMGLDILRLKLRNPRWWVSMEGKIEVGWWTIKGDKAIPGIKNPSTKKTEYGRNVLTGPLSRIYHPRQLVEEERGLNEQEQQQGSSNRSPPNNNNNHDDDNNDNNNNDARNNNDDDGNSSTKSKKKAMEWVGDEDKLFGNGGIMEFL